MKVKKDDESGDGEGDSLEKEGEQNGVGVGHAVRGVIDSLSNLAKWSSHSGGLQYICAELCK
jgi:hypothetical protein